MFKRLTRSEAETVIVNFEGRQIKVPAGNTVAAALLAGGVDYTRSTSVSGARRAPYCLMGVCFECLVEIDGVPNQQSCMIQVRNGMQIKRQRGERGLEG
jgi:predicted molibdopterin-dependent oxidoreductase YjgC